MFLDGANLAYYEEVKKYNIYCPKSTNRSFPVGFTDLNMQRSSSFTFPPSHHIRSCSPLFVIFVFGVRKCMTAVMNPQQFQNGIHLLDSIPVDALVEMDDWMEQMNLYPRQDLFDFIKLVSSPETPDAYKFEPRNRALYALFQIIDCKVIPKLKSAAAGWTFLKIFKDVFYKYQDVALFLHDCLQPLVASGFMHGDMLFDHLSPFEDSVFRPFCNKIICSILHGVDLEGHLHTDILRCYLWNFFDVSQVMPETNKSLKYILYANLVFYTILHRSGYQYEMFENVYPEDAIQSLVNLNQMP